MPTDDAEYEAERRRQQRTHAGGSTAGQSSAFHDFYGWTNNKEWMILQYYQDLI